MKKSYYAPVFGPHHELLRYAGAVVEATGPEGASRQKPGQKQTKQRPELTRPEPKPIVSILRRVHA